MIWRTTLYCFLTLAVTAKCQDKPQAQTAPENSIHPAVVSIFACDAKGIAVSHATGFFISPDGILASTRHAIKNAATATVQMNDGRILNIAGIVAEDPLHDLVLLKTNGSGFPYLKLSAFDQVRGDAPVTMIIDPYIARKEKGSTGEPSHLDERTVGGAVTAVNNLADDYQWFSIRMPVRRGESGSPVLNDAGEVLGMVRGEMGNPGACFAVSVDYIKRLLAISGSDGPKPVSQLQKRDYDDLFDDIDFKASFHAANDGRYKEAARRMELAVRHFPESGAFHALLGSYYARQSMLSEATREFNKAIAINSDNATAWSSVAQVFANQGKLSEAADACKKAVALKSDLPDTWFNVAEVYVILKRYDEARALQKRLQDFKTPEADEMADKLTRVLEMANTQPPVLK